MLNKRKSQSLRVALAASLLMGAIAQFPPCQTANGSTAPRAFVAMVDDGRSVDTGRLLAEALLIVALTGVGLVYVWSEDT